MYDLTVVFTRYNNVFEFSRKHACAHSCARTHKHPCTYTHTRIHVQAHARYAYTSLKQSLI